MKAPPTQPESTSGIKLVLSPNEDLPSLIADARDGCPHAVAGPIQNVENELVGVALDGVDFTGADLRGGDFKRALLLGAVFRNADLRGADLRGTMFSTKAACEGAIYDDTTLFDDQLNPELHGMTRRAVEK